MSTLIPWVGGVGGRSAFDPFSVGTSALLPDLGRLRVDRDDTTAVAQTSVDWTETPQSHIFRADIPGVRKNEMKVQVEEGNILSISGERAKLEGSDTDILHRAERRHGSFLRRFKLPEDANMEDVECMLDHGVLNVTVPKKESTKPERNIRAVDVSECKHI